MSCKRIEAKTLESIYLERQMARWRRVRFGISVKWTTHFPGLPSRGYVSGRRSPLNDVSDSNIPSAQRLFRRSNTRVSSGLAVPVGNQKSNDAVVSTRSAATGPGSDRSSEPSEQRDGLSGRPVRGLLHTPGQLRPSGKSGDWSSQRVPLDTPPSSGSATTPQGLQSQSGAHAVCGQA